MASAARFGKIIPKHSSLFLCDMQEKFRSSVKFFDEIVFNSNRLLRAVKLLEVPVIVTEQYPQVGVTGLGTTAMALGLTNYPDIKPIAKTKFTMFLEEPLKQLASNPDIHTVILCGIETHVCIQQTAIDLRANGYEVFVVSDACSSRGRVERILAFEFLKQAGCWITSTESAILNLAGGSCHPKFKDLQAIIKQEGPDTGLFQYP